MTVKYSSILRHGRSEKTLNPYFLSQATSALEAGLTSVSHLRFSISYLEATLTLIRAQGITYWNVCVHHEAARHDARLSQLMPSFENPIRRRLHYNPSSLTVLILIEEVKLAQLIISYVPFSCSRKHIDS